MTATAIRIAITIVGSPELVAVVQQVADALGRAPGPMQISVDADGAEKRDMPGQESEAPESAVKPKREFTAAELETLRARAAHARAVAAGKRAERGPPPIEPAAPKVSIEPRPPSPPLASPTAPERNLAQMMSTLGTVRVTAAPKPTPAPVAQEPPKKPQPPMSRTEALRRVADAGARRVAAADGPPPAALSVIRTSWPEIKRIAYEEGYPLTDLHSMQAYNRSRERRGLPIFALSPPKAHA